MNDDISIAKCLSYIDSQLSVQPTVSNPLKKSTRMPSITLSRQTGSGGRSIAALLADRLRQNDPDTVYPWTVFDKNLVEKVLEDHHLPKRLAEFMPEDRASTLNDIIEELLGLHPPSWTLFRQTTETILHLAEMGHVILVGRGATVVTRSLDNVLHVRLIASMESRIARMKTLVNCNDKEAQELIHKEDSARKKYVKDHFDQDIESPQLYHLVINTDRVTYDEAGRLIADLLKIKFG